MSVFCKCVCVCVCKTVCVCVWRVGCLSGGSIPVVTATAAVFRERAREALLGHPNSSARANDHEQTAGILVSVCLCVCCVSLCVCVCIRCTHLAACQSRAAG